MKKLLPKEEKEEFKMDFIKTSEAYGYETIADAEDKALAAKYEEGRSEGRDEGIGIGMEKGAEGNGERFPRCWNTLGTDCSANRPFRRRDPKPVISVSNESFAPCGA